MKGDIYFDNDFNYTDGSKGKKLIIILNEPKENEP